jgi:hypothetical protein
LPWPKLKVDQLVDQPHGAIGSANMVVLAGPVKTPHGNPRLRQPFVDGLLEQLGITPRVVAHVGRDRVDEVLDHAANGVAGGGKQPAQLADQPEGIVAGESAVRKIHGRHASLSQRFPDAQHPAGEISGSGGRALARSLQAVRRSGGR